MGTNADNRVQSDVRISDHRNDFHKMETKTQPMKLWGYLLLLVLGLLLGYFIFSHSPSITTVTVTTTDTVYTDTGTHTVTYVPEPVYIKKVITDTIINTIIDTLYIVTDYHKLVHYDDVLVDDSTLYFHYEIDVFKNRITSFTFDYKNKKPTIINNTTTTTTIDKKPLYAGGTAGAGDVHVVYGLTIGYQHKDLIYLIEWDRLNNMHTDKQYNIIKGSILFNF